MTSNTINTSKTTNATNRKPFIKKGMPPPPSKRSNKRKISAVIQDHQKQEQKSTGSQAGSTTCLTLEELSQILDPFFDTCTAVRKQRQDARAAAGAVTAVAAVVTSAPRGDLAAESSESAFLSSVAVDAHSFTKGVASSSALRDFLGAGNSAWMDMVQEMEEEKNDSLPLDVRISEVSVETLFESRGCAGEGGGVPL